jgi:hypothetical protein
MGRRGGRAIRLLIRPLQGLSRLRGVLAAAVEQAHDLHDLADDMRHVRAARAAPRGCKSPRVPEQEPEERKQREQPSAVVHVPIGGASPRAMTPSVSLT